MTNKAKMILTSVIGSAVEAARKDPAAGAVTAENAAAIETALVDAGAKIPEVVNAVSAEPLVQSRILWGIGVAGAGVTGAASPLIAPAVAALAMVLRAFGVDLDAAAQAVWVDAGNGAVALCGLAYAVYGRVAGGLGPMWPRLRRLFGG